MIHEFTIKNGLKVIGVESHKSPVVSVQMWVRNGSADERTGDEGLSHFIEHLVFKGSKKYKVGEIASVVEACGGELNAYTSFDQTVYYVTISKNFFDTALDVISEMMGTPLFDATEIDREREVVLEEIKRSHDSLSRRASRQLFSTLYPDYPYSVPVIGFPEIIKSIPVDRIVSFFKERYVPQNMFLVVTGDFSPHDLQEKVEKHFGFLQNLPAQIPARPPVKMSENRKVVVEEAPFEEGLFYLSWPTTNILNPDAAALEALALILGQGASSRLTLNLRLDKSCVNYISAGAWTPPTQGFFSISAGLNPIHFPTMLTEIKNELEKFFKSGVTADELQKAKINFLSEEAYSIETVGGLARKYGSSYDEANDPFFHEKYVHLLNSVTEEQILRVAKKYLRPERAHFVSIVPRDKQSIENMISNWNYSTFDDLKIPSPTEQKVAAIQRKSSLRADSDCEKAIFANKSQAVWKSSSTAPVFSMRLAFLGGGRVLSPKQAGLTELLSRVWAAKTKNISEIELRTRIDTLASSVYSFSGRNSLGLVVEGLSEFEPYLAEICNDVLCNFNITDDVVDRERNVLLEALRSRKDSPTTTASLMFNKLIYGNHPYAMDLLGNEETLKSIKAKDIIAYLKAYIDPQRAVMSLSGDFDEKTWLPMIETLPTIQRMNGYVDPQVHVNVKELTSNQVGYESATKEQTHLLYGFHGLSLTDKDRFALQIIESVLSGQGGRLFIELRDKASLAYSVSPIKMEGIETGYFGAYIGCSPEKSDTALSMMRVEFDKLMQHKVPMDELQRSKNYLMGRHDIDLQKNSAVASALTFGTLYGLPIEEVFDYAKFINSVTSDDVQRVAQKIFAQKSVVVAVGPTRPTFQAVV